MLVNLENSTMASFHSNLWKGNVKEYSNYCTTALISHAREEMLKILQARLHFSSIKSLSHV